MKKAYVTPTVEKVEFQYNKVVAASGNCDTAYINVCTNGPSGCQNQSMTGSNN